MPRLPAPLSVTAITIATCPFLPLVTNCLTPSITQPSPSGARRGAQDDGVAAGLRLGQAEGAEHAALRQRLQPLLLRCALP